MGEAIQVSRCEQKVGFVVCLIDAVLRFFAQLLVANVVLINVCGPLLLLCLVLAWRLLLLLLRRRLDVVAVPGCCQYATL